MGKGNGIFFLSILLCCVLMLGILPMTGLAAQTETVQKQICADAELPENGELFALFVERELCGNDRQVLGTTARESLNAAEQAIYDVLKPKAEAVALNGGSTKFVFNTISGLKASWTNTELGVASVTKAQIENAFEGQFNMTDILLALLGDCPFDLYWFDKTVGISFGYQVERMGSGGVGIAGTVSDITFVFAVSADYQSGENAVTTNVAKVTTAKNTAAQLAAANEGRSAYEKLVAYKTYICDAVTYNTAATDGNTSYGDPWQLISVFDGDSTTNVVCEGYSKALQYLCELSSVDCISVSGNVTANGKTGRHMWNVVTLEGKNYLADITNSDSGTVGQDGGLFLVGGTYQDGGYRYTIGSQTVDFLCSDLSLAQSDYTPPAPHEHAYDSQHTCACGAIGGACGENASWSFDSETGTFTVSGTGEMHDYGNGPNPWFAYQEQIKSAIIEAAVTSIGSSVFSDCSSLESITIPDSVTSIGSRAFADCSSLESITIPDSVTSIGYYAFEGCSSLKSITIPDGVTSIVSSAFSGCSSLESITIPSSVTSIGSYEFYGCDSLTGIWVDAENPNYSSDSKGVLFNKTKTEIIRAPATISGTYTIPDSVTSIGYAAFSGCDRLTSITIPDSVNAIAYGVFAGCTSLESITIPNSVTSIGSSAFSGCSGLTSITIPDGVTSIGEGVFSNCDRLTGIWVDAENPNYSSDSNGVLFNKTKTVLIAAPGAISEYAIPDSVTSIGYYAFEGCSSLESITIPSSVTSIGGSAFYKCSSLKSITIPDSVTLIGSWAFYDCSSLKSITIPDGVTFIDYSAFYGCSSLKSITIPDGVTSIGERAFSGCSSLTSVTMGNGVTIIGGSAFGYCSSLTDVYITDPIAWCKIAFVNSASNPMYYGDHLHILDEAGNEVTELVLDSSVTAIPDYGFKGCTSLTSITIPDSVTSIGELAFCDCSSLESVTIADSVTSIGMSAFDGCSSLKSITIPDGVTFIGGGAFQRCPNLKSINIPNGLSSIGGCMFSDCTSLQTITIPDGVTSIGNSAFENCTSLESITIPDSVTSIGSFAFSRCTSLKYITIGKGLAAIREYAFSGCDHLSFINIPDSITIIEDFAFKGCTSLTSITIPDGITLINKGMFYNCTSLESVTIPGSIIYIGGAAFYNCDGLADVYYAGTLGNWQFVTVDTYNSSLFSASIHYNHIHDFTGAKKTTAPTCEADGWEGSSCTQCDYVRKDSVLPSTGHTVVKTQDKAPTCTEPGTKSDGTVCKTCGKVFTQCTVYPKLGHSYANDADTSCDNCDAFAYPGGNTLYKEDGKWYHVVNRQKVTDTTLVKYGGRWFHVINGIVDFSSTTLVQYGGRWFHVINGIVDFTSTTLVKYGGKWWYVNKGVVDFTSNTLVQYGGKWFHVKGGNWVQDTTLVLYNGQYWYVQNGIMSTANTLVKYGANWYHVNGGKWYKDTTLVLYNGQYWYVQNGIMNTSNTLVKYGANWYHVNGGKWYKDTTLVQYGGKWYYVRGGIVDFTATTLVLYSGQYWYVQNGVMNTSNTLVKYGANWYHVNGGKWYKDTTLVKYGGKWYYVRGGIVDFQYSGQVPYGGKYYTVKNGVMV